MIRVGNNPTTSQRFQERLTNQALLDFVVTLGDHPEVQTDKDLSALFQATIEDLRQGSSEEHWICSGTEQSYITKSENVKKLFSERIVQQLLSEGNGVNTFIKGSLLANAGPSGLPQPVAASNVNARLAMASSSGDVTEIGRLISEGAEVDGRFTAYIAKENYHLYCIACDPSIQERQKLAVKGQLIGGWTPLKFAVYARQKEAALELIEQRADVNARDKKDQTILMLAAAMGWAEMVEILIAKGAEVNAEGLKVTYSRFSDVAPKDYPAEWTALHAAARLHHLEAAIVLMNNNADVNAETFFGHVPLMYALGNVELFKQLIEHRADVNKSDRLDTDNFRNFCVDIEGVLAPLDDKLNDFSEIVWKRREYDFKSQYRKDTVLHHAVRGNHLEEARLIMPQISNNKDKGIEARGYAEIKPLRLATYKAMTSSGEQQDRAIAMMKLLLHHGADVEDRTSWSAPKYLNDIQDHPERLDRDLAPAPRTLLMYAAVAGAVNVMCTLLEHGADVHFAHDLRLCTPEDKMVLCDGSPAKVVMFETNIFALASKYTPVEVREEVKWLLSSYGASDQPPDGKAISGCGAEPSIASFTCLVM